MNEAVTKRFLLYFRLMLLVWILIVNSILHVVGFAYSWLIFLSNIMLFTMEGDIKDRFVSVELGGLVGMVFTVTWTRTPWLWAKATAWGSSSSEKLPAKERMPKDVPAR